MNLSPAYLSAVAAMLPTFIAQPVMALGAIHAQSANGFDRSSRSRVPENDGLNCLYLQLRLLGYSGTYEAFREQAAEKAESTSVKSLADLGRKLGFPLHPVKMTVSELESAKMPVIVHFEEAGIDSGRFLLVLGMNDEQSDVIDGSYVTFRQLPNERFRRNWTGYALVVQPRAPWQLWLRRSAAAVVLAGAGIWFLTSGRRSFTNWRRSRDQDEDATTKHIGGPATASPPTEFPSSSPGE